MKNKDLNKMLFSHTPKLAAVPQIFEKKILLVFKIIDQLKSSIKGYAVGVLMDLSTVINTIKRKLVILEQHSSEPVTWHKK